MTCESLRTRDGDTFIICSRAKRRRKKCDFCTELSDFQCDGPTTRKGKSCDKHMCRAHATEMAESGEMFIDTIDYCPDCVKAGFQLTLI